MSPKTYLIRNGIFRIDVSLTLAVSYNTLICRSDVSFAVQLSGDLLSRATGKYRLRALIAGLSGVRVLQPAHDATYWLLIYLIRHIKINISSTQ